jgi:hypothetical protein
MNNQSSNFKTKLAIFNTPFGGLGFFVFFLLFIVVSCKKDNSSSGTTYLGYDYFPLKVGDSLIYDVHLKTVDALNTFDTTYQLLERVESVFQDNENRPTLRLERYVRHDSSSPWVIYKVWRANFTNANVEKEEDNITFLKLVFPVALNKEWNGNAKDTIQNYQDYKYISVHQSYADNGLSFDSTLTVEQVNDTTDNHFNPQFYQEKYAARVGMIYKTENKHEYDLTTGTVISSYEYSEKLNWYKN